MIFQTKLLPVYLTTLAAQGDDLVLMLNKHNKVLDHLTFDSEYKPMGQGDVPIVLSEASRINATKIVVINARKPQPGFNGAIIRDAKRFRIECQVYST